MRIQHQNIPKGEVKLQIQQLDDLWYLSHIVDVGDAVSGSTIRKIKIGGGEDRDAKVVRKRIFLTITVEKIEFHKYTNTLRIGGVIIKGPEDVARGEHHTFSIEPDTVISITKKERFLKHQLDKLKESTENKATDCLVCALDRSSAHFALLKKYGYDVLGTLNGSVQKKYVEESIRTNFYAEVVKQLQEYVKRHGIKHLVIGSPAFWKEELRKEIEKSTLKENVTITYAACNADGQNAINEILKRPETKQLLKNERAATEMLLVEKLLSEIAKGDLAVYGIAETKRAADAGALATLLVTDGFIQKMREQGKYAQLDKVLLVTEQARSEIHVISSDHEGGQKLDGLGGIGGILRYAL